MLRYKQTPALTDSFFRPEHSQPSVLVWRASSQRRRKTKMWKMWRFEKQGLRNKSCLNNWNERVWFCLWLLTIAGKLKKPEVLSNFGILSINKKPVA